MKDKVVIEKRYVDAMVNAKPLDVRDRISELLDHVVAERKRQHEDKNSSEGDKE